MYKLATFAIIVNLVLVGCSSSKENEDYDGYSDRPEPQDQIQLETPSDQ